MNNLYKRFWRFAISGLLLIFALSLLPVSALAAPQPQTSTNSNGLQVSNAILLLTATPGQVYVHKMTVSIGSAAQALDMTVEARGFGETLEGSFVPLEADKDTSPFSARSFITKIDKPTFHLNPGSSVTVSVTISVPQDLGSTSRYAMIYFHSQPSAQSNGVNQILAVSVPIVITPQDAKPDLSGAVTDFKVDPIEAGKPISIEATVKNNGNHQFKVQGDALITDSTGKTVVDLPIPQTNTSIIPTYSQLLKVSYSALDHPEGLAAGTYKVTLKLLRDDQSVVDSTKTTTFDVTAPLQVCPGVDADHVLVTSFKDQEPGSIDARTQTGVQIIFEGTGKVTGQVAICGYTQAPTVKPDFSAAPADGGTGGTAVRYITLRVDGFTLGVAHVSVAFKQPDLNGLDPNSLFLSYLHSDYWTKLDNLSVQTGAQVVLGDIQVDQLTQGALIALGSAAGNGGGSQSAGSSSIWLTPPVLIGYGLVLLLLVILIIVLLSNRRNDKKTR